MGKKQRQIPNTELASPMIVISRKHNCLALLLNIEKIMENPANEIGKKQPMKDVTTEEFISAEIMNTKNNESSVNVENEILLK